MPWKGYFDLISYVDEFIIFDDMQYTRRDWRNRNKIKTPNGLEWLTVPVQVKGKYDQRIMDVSTEGDLWKSKHLSSIMHNYRKSLHFESSMDWLTKAYDALESNNLSSINTQLIREVCNHLEIDTKISSSLEYSTSENPSTRLAQICLESEAGVYVSGPSARDYIETSVFEDREIEIEWFHYDNFPEYPQLWGKFESHVSVIDSIMNCGPHPENFLRGTKK
jgi:hypothetical protein